MSALARAGDPFACRSCRRTERFRHARCAGCGMRGTIVPASELPPDSTFPLEANTRDDRNAQELELERSEGRAHVHSMVDRDLMQILKPTFDRVKRGASTPTPITEIAAAANFRFSTGIAGLDRVCGIEPMPPAGGAPAGCVRGGVYLLSGSPGAGKSTLLMQMVACIAGDSLVLYASGEEAASQIAARAHRLDAARPSILLVSETDLEAILAHARALRPRVLVVDSISTISTTHETGIAGSVTQVKACASEIARYAQDPAHPTTVFMIGHVTQDGAIAGPKTLQHLVDAIFELDGDTDPKTDTGLRVLTSTKNRFGSTLERAAFRMTAAGLVEVDEEEAAALDAERDAQFQPIAQELLNRYLALGGHLDDGLRERIDNRLDLEMWRETRYPA